MTDLPQALLDDVKHLTALARAEDLGEVGDVTSLVFVPEEAVGVGTFVQKEAGVPAGLPLVKVVAAEFSERLEVSADTSAEGVFSDETPRELLTVRGPLRDLLTAERTMLNLLTHLGGIATLTHAFAAECAGTRARIYDTRKTHLGHRRLEKYAVRVGGGANHRMGLFDMVLVKDNHLSGVADLESQVREAVGRAKATYREVPIEVEVDTLQQLADVLKVADVDVILLDNMPPATMREAVALRDAAGHRAELEASGGIDLATVAAAAATGVERIAVGAVTHSAPALDVGLDVRRL